MVTDRSPHALDLSGTSWTVEEIAGRPTLAATPPTIAFAAGGRLSGSTGVNRFTASYTVIADELSFGPLATTRRMGSPAEAEQQQLFLAALSRPCRLRLDGSTLLLVHEHGVTRLTRTAAPEAAPERSQRQSRVVVRGTVTYRERVPLPARAVVRVLLLDASLGDGEPTVLAEQLIRDPRKVPVRFELALPASAVDPDAWLTVVAQVLSGDQVLWASTGDHPVLTRGATDLVHVVLRRVRPGSR